MPSATAPSLRETWQLLPAPVLHPVKEVKAEPYFAPQLDGREKADSMQDGTAAIVIDNGRLFQAYCQFRK
jgi:hypothetical protein